MLIVLDPAGAEGDLRASEICCPSCTSGRLRPWGYARTRVLRGLRGARVSVRPRRARCRSCTATHVLLPAEVAPRRADTVEVVVTALLAHHAGSGYRAIAADLHVPADTVRSWLRRITGRAEWLRQTATVCDHAVLGQVEQDGRGVDGSVDRRLEHARGPDVAGCSATSDPPGPPTNLRIEA